ncbi:hypothetical protein IU510_21185 [Nocardia cyriacigeorgica]|uniref:hypothetical protein n=1 Tax=Nocardia TaxID=1817 RepID=UPI00189425F3|nr:MULTISPECIES: hypothetical protein [Nocardia]MBF6100576.1 hypothetical protein [Nocardia cyriacigeorgica]
MFRTLASHQVAAAGVSLEPAGRLRPNVTADRVQEQRQATLLRLLSITEAFAADLLAREVEKTFAGLSSAVLTAAVDDSLISATNTWREQSKAYSKWLNIKRSAVDWGPIERLAHARNAIAHGLGELTRRQRQSGTSIPDQLLNAGITIENGRVVLTDQNLRDAAQTCRVFIESLDHAVHDA